MRAWELALLIIFVELSIGLLDGMEVFDHKYVTSEQYLENKYTMGITDDMISQEKEMTINDYFNLGVALVFSSLNFLLSVFTPLVCLYPILVTKLGCPEAIAAVIQTGIYLYLGLALYQWKANRSESMMS